MKGKERDGREMEGEGRQRRRMKGKEREGRKMEENRKKRERKG